MYPRRALLLAVPFLLSVTACADAAVPLAPPPFTSDRISVTVEGDGPDVVLIPGLASSPSVWRGTINATPGFRYHLVQVNGFAGAPALGNARGPVAAPVAEEIARYIAHERLDRPALVGHSMGGTLAMMVAARSDALISKVMVVDIPPFIGAAFGPPGMTAAEIAPLANIIREVIMSPSGALLIERVQSTGVIGGADLRAAVAARSNDSDLAVSAQAMYDLLTTDLREEVAQIAVPLRVLYVRPPSNQISAAQTEAFYQQSFAQAPQATLERIPNASHFIMQDAPERFQAEFRAFLAG